MAKRLIEHVRHARQRPRNKPDAKLVALDMRQLLPDVRFTAKSPSITATDDSEATGARNGGRQATARNQCHRGAHDRIPNSESLGQPRSQFDLLRRIMNPGLLSQSPCRMHRPGTANEAGAERHS